LIEPFYPKREWGAASAAEEPKVCGLSAGGGSHERTRLLNANFPGYWEKYREFRPIPTRALINASQSKVLRPKFPGAETGKFSKAEQRIDLPHQGKLLRDQRKKQPTEEREGDSCPICFDATLLQNLQPIT
jgi:hypothetical protein